MSDAVASNDRWMRRGRHRPLLSWVWLTLVVVLGFFLFTEHRAHLFGVLPFLLVLLVLLVLLCPLVHLFMHHGHGGHTHGSSAPNPSPNREARP